MKKYITVRSAIAIPLILTMVSCDLSKIFGEGDSEDSQFSPEEFYGESKVIEGNEFVLHTWLDIKNPEVYIGEERLEASMTREEETSTLRISVPEPLTDAIISAAPNGVAEIRLKASVDDGKDILEGTIAQIKLYRKSHHFIKDITTGTPSRALLDGCHAIYAKEDDWNDSEEYYNQDCGKSLRAVTSDGTRLFAFADLEGKELRHVKVHSISNISGSYIFADLEWPVSVDTLYNDWESGIGNAYQSFSEERRAFIIDCSDGSLLDFKYHDICDEHSFSCVDGNMFWYAGNNYNEYPATIDMYKISDGYVQEMQSADVPGKPEGSESRFTWAANEKNGVITWETKLYAFDDFRTDDLYYEDDYVQKLPNGSTVCGHFTAGDGSFHMITRYLKTGSPEFDWRTRLYAMDENDIYRPVSVLEFKWGTLDDEIHVVHSGNDTYLIGRGPVYRIDENGKVSETGFVFADDFYMGDAVRIYPYTSRYFYYSKDSKVWRKRLDDMSEPEAIHTAGQFNYDRMIQSGDKCIAMEYLSEGCMVHIFEGNEHIGSSTIEPSAYESMICIIGY